MFNITSVFLSCVSALVNFLDVTREFMSVLQPKVKKQAKGKKAHKKKRKKWIKRRKRNVQTEEI